MSIQQARAFIEAGRVRQEVRAAVNERLVDLPTEEMVHAVVEVGKANGFDFSAEEYREAAGEIGRELSADQLDRISAGTEVGVVYGQEITTFLVY